ncbi:MAG: transporter substrate-binding domain-containing protein [Desulfomonile tiedjei]|uniref:Transporter substrate-binding domain-containing protein n=1 Tax=Desulfomonile tiedjei TaxID=2358 RepID=A0A9D6Z5L9_9BACT|nr:transporter substrate-binding domain-containing protein [Desulfomonile tiedjei]
MIDYSRPYFPTAIWVVARKDSDLQPITPRGDIRKDVAATKALVAGKELLGIRNTCVDPMLYDIADVKASYRDNIGLNDLAAVVIKGDAAICIMDVPDALIALQKYQAMIKVLGTITEKQYMGFGFSKDSPELRESFNAFLTRLQKTGKLTELLVKYYPSIRLYFPEAGQE